MTDPAERKTPERPSREGLHQLCGRARIRCYSPGTCQRRHRHQECVACLDHLHATVSREPGTAIHVVIDNYGTHKHPRVRDWFARHPESVPHFTPTSSSWLNQVERFIVRITTRRIRRGSFRSVGKLEQATADYLRTHNERPKPFVWTKPADLILRKVQKIAERLAPPPKNQKRTSDSGLQEEVLRWFHIDLLQGTLHELVTLVEQCRRVIDGTDAGQQTWRQLHALNHLGVSRDTLNLL